MKSYSYRKYLINILFIATSFLFLISCAATYIEPAPGQPVATIKGYGNSQNLHNYEFARIIYIDGKYYSDGYDNSKNISVTPGFHTFGVKTIYVHGFLSTRYENLTPISATLKAGKHYSINQTIHDKQINISIIDEKGTKVSPVVTVTSEPQRPSMVETINYLNIIK